MYDLINIFDVFLPQLMLYPNPADPLNGEAANLLIKDPDKYKEKVKEYVKKYASDDVLKEINVGNNPKEDENDENDPSQLSELSNASFDEDGYSEAISDK